MTSVLFNSPINLVYFLMRPPHLIEKHDYRASGLMYDTADTRKSTAANVLIFCNGKQKELKSNKIAVYTNTPDWTPFTRVSWTGSLVYMAIHDGIRSVDKQTPILIGNIASDRDADAIKRMYGDPVKGQFDGAIINAYFALVEIARNSMAEFDKHGDTTKTIWQEEGSDQRSPNIGPGRRYGEWEGAANLVRSWVSLACKAHPRIRAITQWGFVPRTRLEWVADRAMMDIGLQPRPQFVAHAIMADAMADAQYKADHSTPAISAFEFKRSDDALVIAWAIAGERELSLKTTGDLTIMDIMGNRTTVAPRDGVAAVKLGVSPLYISGSSLSPASRR